MNYNKLQWVKCTRSTSWPPQLCPTIDKHSARALTQMRWAFRIVESSAIIMLTGSVFRYKQLARLHFLWWSSSALGFFLLFRDRLCWITGIEWSSLWSVLPKMHFPLSQTFNEWMKANDNKRNLKKNGRAKNASSARGSHDFCNSPHETRETGIPNWLFIPHLDFLG